MRSYLSICVGLALWCLAPSAANAACAPVPPVQRDINTQKAYEDKNGSARDQDIWDSNERELGNLTAFVTLIESDADAYVDHGDKSSATCATQAIGSWASGGALQGSMSYHGYLDRMWAAGAIALALLKLHQPLDAASHQWLATVCAAARQETETHTQGFGLNNLSYWGALDVGACGLVLNNSDDWRFAQQVMHAGIANIQPDGTLQHELTRRQRATHYQEFAAQPLVVLARLSAWKGQPIDAEEHARLDKLVNLVIAAVNNPQLLAQAARTHQKPIRMPGWLVMWNGSAPSAAGHDAIYEKLGGDTRVLNAVLSSRH
jgi:poly(beta-D-mannuronate) lyase